MSKENWKILALIVIPSGSILFMLAIAIFFQMGFFDPCYKRYPAAKGFHYEIRADRVCMESGHAFESIVVRTLEGADPKTFQNIDGIYFRDKNHVYYGIKVVDGAKPDTFKSLGNSYYKDKGSIFYQGKRIEADYDTFSVIGDSHEYAKDKNYVYEYGKVINGIDPYSFETLSWSGYAKDKNHVYHKNIILNDVDPETFEIFQDNMYGKDERRVYYYGKLIPGADPTTFVVRDSSFAEDKNSVYFKDKALGNLDVDSYQFIGNSRYLRDSDSLYYSGEEIKGADGGAFHLVTYKKKTGRDSYFVSDSKSCGTDGKVVICHGELIEGGEIIDREEALDFQFGRLLEPAGADRE